MRRPIKNKLAVVYIIVLCFSLMASMEAHAGDTLAAGSFREKNLLQKESAEKNKALIEAKISKIKSFRSSLVLPKDAAAYAKAEEALRVAEETLKKVNASISRLDKISQSEYLVLPGSFKGAVFREEEGKWLPFDGESAFAEGDLIRTGTDGEITLDFSDGTKFDLGPNTSFKLHKKTRLETLIDFIVGKFRAKINTAAGIGATRAEVRINTPTAVCAVRGTEFDLSVDEQGLTHLKLYSGKVDLSAIPNSDAERRIQNRWWTLVKSDGLATRDSVKSAVVEQVRGAGVIKGKDGKNRPVKNGLNIENGEEVSTDKGSFISMVLPGGWTVVLGAESSLAFRKDSGGKIGYILEKGMLYGAGGAKDAPPIRFAAFSTAADISSGAFEVSASGQDAAGWTIFEGMMKINASANE